MSFYPRFKRCWVSSKALLWSITCACWLLFCLAQESKAQQNKLVVTPAEAVAVKHGGIVTQSLRVTVLPGFHVNNDKPRDEYLIPLKVMWTGGPLEAKSITYPKPEEVKVGTDMLTVFTGTFEIQTEFKAPEQAQSGSGMETGKLRYQACNSEMCFRPATIDVKVPVTIE